MTKMISNLTKPKKVFSKSQRRTNCKVIIMLNTRILKNIFDFRQRRKGRNSLLCKADLNNKRLLALIYARCRNNAHVRCFRGPQLTLSSSSLSTDLEISMDQDTSTMILSQKILWQAITILTKSILQTSDYLRLTMKKTDRTWKKYT